MTMAKLKLAALWLIVGLPLAWGVAKTVQNAVKLFQ
jgi:hypothetical protein